MMVVKENAQCVSDSLKLVITANDQLISESAHETESGRALTANSSVVHYSSKCEAIFTHNM